MDIWGVDSYIVERILGYLACDRYVRDLARFAQTCRAAHRAALPLILEFLRQNEARRVRVGERQEWHDEDGQIHRWGAPIEVIEENWRTYLLSRQPAAIGLDGTEYWYCHGKLHRVGAPAIVCTDGTEEWYCQGRLHNATGPAVKCSDGTEMWYWHGDLHRAGGPALLSSDGTRIWYSHGCIHRNRGPAIIRPDGTSERWYWGMRIK